MLARLAAAWRALTRPAEPDPLEADRRRAGRHLAASPEWCDLIRESLEPYGDAEVGAAVRALQGSARRSLGWAGSGGEGQDAREGPQKALRGPPGSLR